MDGPVLSVVLVNHNCARWIHLCLRSLNDALVRTAPGEVIVVDNASSDDSVDIIRREFPQSRILLNDTNEGFATAANRGVLIARGRYVLLMNFDVTVQCGIDQLVSVLEGSLCAAAAAPRTLDRKGKLRGGCGHFSTLWRLIPTMLLLHRVPLLRRWVRPLLIPPGRFYDTEHQVEWASAACLLIKRSALDQVGLLDEDYWMYCEDVDWCYRAHLAGLEVIFTPKAEIVHYGAGGGEWRGWKGKEATLHTYRGYMLFCRKHLPAWQWTFMRGAIFAGALIRILGALGWWCFSPESERTYAREMVTTFIQVAGIGLRRDRHG